MTDIQCNIDKILLLLQFFFETLHWFCFCIWHHTKFGFSLENSVRCIVCCCCCFLYNAIILIIIGTCFENIGNTSVVLYYYFLKNANSDLTKALKHLYFAASTANADTTTFMDSMKREWEICKNFMVMFVLQHLYIGWTLTLCNFR